jgi:hypothetical protein
MSNVTCQIPKSNVNIKCHMSNVTFELSKSNDEFAFGTCQIIVKVSLQEQAIYLF